MKYSLTRSAAFFAATVLSLWSVWGLGCQRWGAVLQEDEGVNMLKGNNPIWGSYAARADVSLTDYRAALRRNGGPNFLNNSWGTEDSELIRQETKRLLTTAGEWKKQQWPPKETDSDPPCYRWLRRHVRVQKLDNDHLRVFVSADTKEEAAKSLKTILHNYLEGHAGEQKDVRPNFKRLPKWDEQIHLGETPA